MSSTVLIWQFKVQDGTSGPVKAAQRALKSYEKQLAAVERAALKADRAAFSGRRNGGGRGNTPTARRLAETVRSYNRLQAQSLRADMALFAGRGRRMDRSAGTQRRLNETVRELASRETEAASSGLSLGAVLGGVGIAIGALGAGVGIVMDIGGAFVSIGTDIARATIALAGFREQSLTTLRVISGGNGAEAGRLFSNAITTANQTPSDTASIIGQTVGLRTAGFSEREINPLLAGIADVQAGFGNQSAESLQLVLSQMRAAGRIDGGDLRQLLNAGVNTGDVLDNVANSLNLAVGQTQAQRRAAARAAISARRVSGDVGIQAALDAIRTRLDSGGPLGTLARTQAGSLLGALSNLRNAIPNFVLSIGFEALPGVQAFKDAIVTVTGAFNAATPTGRRLQALFAGIVNRAGLAFGALTPDRVVSGIALVTGYAERFVGFVATAVPVALRLGRAILSGFGSGASIGFAPVLNAFRVLASSGSTTGPSVERVATALRYAAAVGGLFLGVFVSLMTWPVETAAIFVALGRAISDGAVNLYHDAQYLGSQLGEGIAEGIRATRRGAEAAVDDLANALPGPLARALRIHSPSRVFADLGSQIPAGLELGIADGTAAVTSTVRALVAPPTLAAGGLGGASGTTVTFGDIIIQGGSTNAETASAVRESLEETLADLFDRLAETQP